jgi:putative membrane protein
MILAFCGSAIFISEKNKSKAAIAYLSIFILGFIIEYIGVKTNYLFGTYTYGNSLGYKLFGIPIIIGVNWIAIVISSVSVIKAFNLTSNILLIAFLAALLCTGMDYIIEPIAIKFDFWSWEGNTIPLSNFVDWFGFSFIFACIYLVLKLSINKIGVYLFLIWVGFFSLIKLMG